MQTTVLRGTPFSSPAATVGRRASRSRLSIECNKRVPKKTKVGPRSAQDKEEAHFLRQVILTKEDATLGKVNRGGVR